MTIPTGFQVDHSDWDEGNYEPVVFEDTNPMAVLERCLEELRERVPVLPESIDKN